MLLRSYGGALFELLDQQLALGRRFAGIDCGFGYLSTSGRGSSSDSRVVEVIGGLNVVIGEVEHG